MEKYDRDVVLRVVKARMNRQEKEQNALSERVKELSGIGVDAAQEEDPRQEAIMDALMPEIAEIMTDMVFSEEPFDVSLDTAMDELIDSIAWTATLEGEGVEPEDIAMLRVLTKGVVGALLEEFLPDDDSSGLLQLNLDEIIEIANNHGVEPEEVIIQDELYRELIRMTITEEEFLESFSKVLELYDDPERIFSIFVEPMIAGLVAHEEVVSGEKISDLEVAEMREEMMDEFTSNPEVQQQFAAIRIASEMALKERIIQYFGASE